MKYWNLLYGAVGTSDDGICLWMNDKDTHGREHKFYKCAMGC